MAYTQRSMRAKPVVVATAAQQFRFPYKAPGLPRRCVITAAKSMRVDRVLSSLGYCTRSECPAFLKSHVVSAEGLTVAKPSMKV